MNNEQTEHIPVLLNELAEHISLPKDGVVVDATLGHGGHSLMFGGMLGPRGIIFGADVDGGCIQRAQSRLSGLSCKVVLVRENFAELAGVLAENETGKADLILADLGFCSAQMSDPSRGLSFQEDMPLDMRLDERLRTTASDIVNGYDEMHLADVIYEYGEERASRRIARFIVEYRRSRPIRTTGELSMIVCRAMGQAARGRKSKIHPATRTFQALRIAVNGELDNLAKLLADAPELLKIGGRIAVISFHSLEDRLVKHNFRENKQKGIYKIATKKPITASVGEIRVNPRSRSAKLRIAERI